MRNPNTSYPQVSHRLSTGFPDLSTSLGPGHGLDIRVKHNTRSPARNVMTNDLQCGWNTDSLQPTRKGRRPWRGGSKEAPNVNPSNRVATPGPQDGHQRPLEGPQTGQQATAGTTRARQPGTSPTGPRCPDACQTAPRCEKLRSSQLANGAHIAQDRNRTPEPKRNRRDG